ncbi:MAG: hypothetical protein Q9227_003355 [Pyrenula ochraceoflavens]
MAAAAGLVMGVIGLAMGGVGMVPLMKSFAPDKTDQTTTVRIGVGTSTDSSATTQGNVPGIALFDVVGRPIGESRGSHDTIGDGSFQDIKVEAPDDIGGRQAEYISISKGGNDALCIAYITVTWPDNSKYIFSGDVGYQCGAHWYPSQTTFGESNPGYKPRCFWIDGDSSNGITTQGIGLHITDFEATKERSTAFNKDQDLMCKSAPRFKLYDQLTSDMSLPYFDPPLEFVPGTLVDKDPNKVKVPGSNRDPKNAPPSRRSLQNRNALSKNSFSSRETHNLQNHNATHHGFLPYMPSMTGILITSNDTLTSAIELCKSDTSRGPDHVSFTEKMFCDMQTKILWPLCIGSRDIRGCFDTLSHSMRPAKRILRRGEASVPDKSYHTVNHWH